MLRNMVLFGLPLLFFCCWFVFGLLHVVEKIFRSIQSQEPEEKLSYINEGFMAGLSLCILILFSIFAAGMILAG